MAEIPDNITDNMQPNTAVSDEAYLPIKANLSGAAYGFTGSSPVASTIFKNPKSVSDLGFFVQIYTN
jgi:hypothetical protein